MKRDARILQIDNIKCILIFTVVFGHLCEHMSFQYKDYIYLLIYSFHMPAFAFISGYCCKKMTGEKLIAKYLYPYFIFQTLYIIFSKKILHESLIFQYTTPYWILWYLLSLFMWNLVISLLNDTLKSLKIIICVGIIVALLVGYEKTVAYYLSLSRTFVIFPFFASGYYMKKKGYPIFEDGNKNIGKWIKVILVISVFLVCALLYFNQDWIQVSWAYHSQPYQVLQYNFCYRLCFGIAAIVIIIFFCLFITKKKLYFATHIGQNTLGIFLLHGFIVRYLAYKNILQNLPHQLLSAVMLTVLILFICSSKMVRKILRPFIEWRINI